MGWVSYVATAFGSYTFPFLARATQVWEPSFRPASVAGGRTHGVLDGWGMGAAPVEAGNFAVPFVIAGSPSTVRTAELQLGAALGMGRQRLLFNPESSGVGPQLFTDARAQRVRRSHRNGLSQKGVEIDLSFFLPCYRLMQALNEELVETYLEGSEYAEVEPEVFGESWEERGFGFWANPTTVTIDLPGSLRCPLIIRIEAAGVGGYTNPSITNAATGQTVTVNRTAAGASSVLQINTELDAGGVRESVDGGASLVSLGYGVPETNAWPDTVLPDNQGPILELAPGENVLTITGVGNAAFGVLVRPWYLL